ncbi:hypothetical protein [Streptomyces sp. NRRL WC-3618]|uniref:hypothetical protein n=1 Tax=Streptomyces sp. NRRL WC-3618 TaxID=1519490 RepID=UPI0006AFFC4C|nr:hypothetical protein [Streptomyces sp. NRRL WC-3618]
MTLATSHTRRLRPARHRRLSIRNSPWPDGSQVLLRQVRGERTWRLLPVTVLYDDGQRYVFRVQAGSTWLDVGRAGTDRSHGRRGGRQLTTTGGSEHDLTYVVDRFGSYSVAMSTDPASGELVKWYVRAQNPLRRRSWGFDTSLVAEGIPSTAGRLKRGARRHVVGRLADAECRAALVSWTRPPAEPLDVRHLIDRLAPVLGVPVPGGRDSAGAVATGAAKSGLAASPVLVADDLTPRRVYVASGRARRPVSVAEGCPFCPGGREVPPDFETAAFPNRWPPIATGRCEVLVHSPDHTRDFAGMSRRAARRVVDLWARRGEVLAGLDDVRCVLVFENRGTAAGATVEHPHSQIFALPVLPPLLEPVRGNGSPAPPCPACVEPDPALLVEQSDGWRASVPPAPPAPYTVRLTAPRHVASLAELDPAERDGLAAALIRTVRRLDRLFQEPMPYQLWTSRPAHGSPDGHVSVTVAGLLSRPGRPRILGAAELATGLYFTPVGPSETAAALKGIDPHSRPSEERR